MNNQPIRKKGKNSGWRVEIKRVAGQGGGLKERWRVLITFHLPVLLALQMPTN